MLNTGDEINGWRLIEPLGSGHFSPVWRVRRDDVEGALKPAVSGSQESFDRLAVEIESLRRFDHQNIPKVLDADLDAGTPYLVMQLATGQTILDRIVHWNTVGRVHGELEALNIITQLMDAVAYIHKSDRVHRDIKDANIIVDGETKAFLIDFGFCKPTAAEDLRTRDSFWRAGAARFSPLEKINNPSRAVPSHDVYAIGVIAYRLLTGQFPYGEEDTLANLRQRYMEIHPVSIHNVNRMVSLPLSRLVEWMIEQHDDERISSTAALEELQRITPDIKHENLELDGSVHVRLVRARRTQFPHVIRDPLAGDIRITDQEYAVLGSREMQRLRWIRQLGLTNLVYPGANHSRLSHSIGTVHTAETMMRAIEDESGVRIDTDTRAVTRLYALTHDFAHIALGHTIEDQLGLFARHDINQGRFDRLIDSNDSELRQALCATDQGKLVVDLLNPARPEKEAQIAYQIVAGTMGADVLDYIDRDAYFCGLDHKIDSAIYRQISLNGPRYNGSQRLVSQIGGKYGIRTDRTAAIEHLLDERYAMFLKVYTHSAKIAADAVLGKALAAYGALPEATIECLGDESLLNLLISRKKSLVSTCGNMLKTRRLPRGVYRCRLAEALSDEQGERPSLAHIRDWIEQRGLHTAKGRLSAESTIAKKAGVEPDGVFVYVPITPPGYQRADHWVSEGRSEAHRQAGEDISRRHLNLWELWVFVDTKDSAQRKELASMSQLIFGLKNMIQLQGHSGALF